MCKQVSQQLGLQDAPHPPAPHTACHDKPSPHPTSLTKHAIHNHPIQSSPHHTPAIHRQHHSPHIPPGVDVDAGEPAGPRNNIPLLTHPPTIKTHSTQHLTSHNYHPIILTTHHPSPHSHAITKPRQAQKWMLVNLQDHENFASHRLNRDVWCVLSSGRQMAFFGVFGGAFFCVFVLFLSWRGLAPPLTATCGA